MSGTARGWLFYVHRWLGIAGCLLFLAWFCSGIVMMYARMPAITNEERLLHAEPLGLSSVRVSPSDALAKAGAPATAADGLRVTMLRGRPVYRLPAPSTTAIFADTGEVLAPIDRADRDGRGIALDAARRWAPAWAESARFDRTFERSDQWTLQAPSRLHLPLHRIVLVDPGDTHLYVSSRTGEVVMETTRRERFWAWLGPITHWLYLPVLRRNGPLWSQVIIWLSAIGCVMCLTGLIAGLLQFSPRARFRLRSGRAQSPYTGMMWWHHYAGLLFGVVTFTWTVSGLLSMSPFPALSDGGVSAAQQRAVKGAPTGVVSITRDHLRSAAAAIGRDFTPRELTLILFRGEPYWMSDAVPSPRHAIVPAARPEAGAFAHFDRAVMETVARQIAPPGRAIRDMTWLREYDAYYYDRRGGRPLPVLRVRYDDEPKTWLYLDPQRGAIAASLGSRSRLNRWLYQGLHSLDLPALYHRRPLWDIVVITLSLGGIALGITSLKPAWVRLRRHVRLLTSEKKLHGQLSDPRRAR